MAAVRFPYWKEHSDMAVSSWKLNFKKRLLLFSLAISIVPVLVLGLLTSYYVSSLVQSEANRNHEISLNQLRNQVDAYMEKLGNVSKHIASDPVILRSMELGMSVDSLEAMNSTLDMIAAITHYRTISQLDFHISLLYRNFDKVYTSRGGLKNPTELAYYPFLAGFGSDSRGLSSLPPHSYPGQEEFLLIHNMFGGNRGSDGVVILEFDPDELYQLLASWDLGNSSRVVVADKDGRIVYSDAREEIGNRLTPGMELYQALSERETYLDKYWIDGRSYNLTVSESAVFDWRYIAMTPVQELEKKSQNIRTLMWLIIAAVVAIWALVAAIVSNRIYSPIYRLMKRIPQTEEARDEWKALDVYMNFVEMDNEHLRAQLHRQLPFLKENTLLRLMKGEISRKDLMSGEQQQLLGIVLEDAWYHVGIAKIDHFADFKLSYSGGDRGLIMYALSKMIQEIGEEKGYFCLTASPQVGKVVFLIGIDEQSGGEEAQSLESAAVLMDDIRAKVGKYFQFTISIALSAACKDPDDIQYACEEAEELLSYRLLVGQDVTITSSSVSGLAPSGRMTRILVKMQKAIVRSVAEGDLRQAEEQFADLLQEMPKHLSVSKAIFGLFTHLIGDIENLLEEAGQDIGELLDNETYARLNAASSIAEVDVWFQQFFFPAVRAHFERAIIPNRKKTGQQIMAYIQEHFDEDLSLAHISEQFHLSTYQISRILKEEMNTSFLEYLIAYRISKAKEWLVYTNMSIKEISDRLRYTTTQNFSRVFKQMTGVPPGKYREDKQP